MNNINNNLSSRATHHSLSRYSPYGRMRDIVVGFFNAPLYPGLQISGMTNGAGAFTLIELLVVVLIIGILAAVALPQYTLAVNKSRFANLRTISKSFIDATKAYQLANGEYPQDMEELSIDYPAGMTPNSLTNGQQGSCAKNSEIYCCISKQGSGLCDSVVCGRNDYSFAFQYNHAGCHVASTDETAMCAATSSDTNAVKLCRSYGAAIGTYGLITPDGVKSSYNFYRIQL